MQHHSTIFQPAQEDAFLAELQTCVTRIANNLYFAYRHFGVDAQDLSQEGMLAGWKAFHKVLQVGTFDHAAAWAYCLKCAKGAMMGFILRKDKIHATSLDAYLTRPDGSQIDMLDDTPTALPEEERDAKHLFILQILEHLTDRERAVLMAEYAIDGQAGYAPERDPKLLGISQSSWFTTKYRALAKAKKALQIHA